MARFPTQDLQHRLLMNGGRIPSGLFRPNFYRSKRGHVSPGAAAAAAANPALPYELDALARMLRDLTNINVRPPSHVTPPFRAAQFLFQLSRQGVVGPEDIPVTINGNAEVPQGTNAVVYFVSYTVGPIFNGVNTVPAWGETAASQLTLTLKKNGQAIPGLAAILPTYSTGANLLSGADFLTQAAIIPQAPIVPITLTQGDFLSLATLSSATAGAYIQIAGYTYPIELDGDGVRGTLADRG